MPSGRLLAVAITTLDEHIQTLTKHGFVLAPGKRHLLVSEDLQSVAALSGVIQGARSIKFDPLLHAVSVLSPAPPVPDDEQATQGALETGEGAEPPPDEAGESDDQDQTDTAPDDEPINGSSERDDEDLEAENDVDEQPPSSQGLFQGGGGTHEDVGDVRGFARKDISRLRTEVVIQTMAARAEGDLLRAIEVYTRDALWPPRSARGHEIDGRDAGAAVIYDRVRLSFLKNATETGKPRRIYRASWERTEAYAHVIRWSKQLFDDVKTLEQANRALDTWRGAFAAYYFTGESRTWGGGEPGLGSFGVYYRQSDEGIAYMASHCKKDPAMREHLLSLSTNGYSSNLSELLLNAGSVRRRSSRARQEVYSALPDIFEIEVRSPGAPWAQWSPEQFSDARKAIQNLRRPIGVQAGNLSATPDNDSTLGELKMERYFYMGDGGRMVAELKSLRWLDDALMKHAAQVQGTPADELKARAKEKQTDKATKAPSIGDQLAAMLKSRRSALEHYEKDGDAYLVGSKAARATRQSADTFDGLQLRAEWGFRGVEYGEWVSQAERGEHLVQIDQAFADLQLITGWPKEAFNLRGELGIGIGSRGKGGAKSPPAVYQPGNRAVAFTRMSGSGAMAHEFGHALDHHLGGGNLVPDGKKLRGNYLTLRTPPRAPDLPPIETVTEDELDSILSGQRQPPEASRREAFAVRMMKALRHRHPDSFDEADWTAITGIMACYYMERMPPWVRPGSAASQAKDLWGVPRDMVDVLEELSKRSDISQSVHSKTYGVTSSVTTWHRSFRKEPLSVSQAIASDPAKRKELFAEKLDYLSQMAALNTWLIDSGADKKLLDGICEVKDMIKAGRLQGGGKKLTARECAMYNSVRSDTERILGGLAQATELKDRLVVLMNTDDLSPLFRRGVTVAQKAHLAGYNDVEVAQLRSKIIVEDSSGLLDSCKTFYHAADLVTTTHFSLASAATGEHEHGYWDSKHEMFARAFEVWVSNELKGHGISNRYLSNVGVVKPSSLEDTEFIMTRRLKSVSSMDEFMRFLKASCPYPDAKDMIGIKPAMGNFLKTLKTTPTVINTVEGTQREVQVLYSRDDSALGSLSVGDFDKATRQKEAIAALRNMLGQTAQAYVVPSISQGVSGATVRRLLDNKAMVLLASENRNGKPLDLLATGHHEAMHVAYELLFTHAERGILHRAFSKPQSPWVRRTLEAADQIEGAESRLRVKHEIRTQPQEAMAYAFQFYACGKMRGGLPKGPVSGLIDRFSLLVERCANLVRGHGFTSTTDLFADLQSGALATRANAPAQTLISAEKASVGADGDLEAARPHAQVAAVPHPAWRVEAGPAPG